MGTLYVLSTPIGNLSDLSERAKYILDNIEYVIAEDTRAVSYTHLTLPTKA